ncbi:Zinc finger protein, partial [Musa troglodytarum]
PLSTLSPERETETLNRARQLVFSNDGAIGYVLPSRPSPFALSSRSIHGDPSTGEACLQFHPVYPGLPNPPPPMSQYLHPSSSSSHSLPQPRCYIGHVVSGSSQRQPPHHGYSPDPSFTRYGAPVSRSFPVEEGRAPAAGRGNQLRSEFRTCPPQLALLGEPSAPGMALTYTS